MKGNTVAIKKEESRGGKEVEVPIKKVQVPGGDDKKVLEETGNKKVLIPKIIQETKVWITFKNRKWFFRKSKKKKMTEIL